MKKGIIFDKDGTLLDFEAFWLPVTEGTLSDLAGEFRVPGGAVQAAKKKLGVIAGRADRNGALCMGTYASIAELIRAAFAAFGAEAGEREMYGAVCRAFRDNLFRGEIIPTSPRLCEVLRNLKGGGCRLFVVTSDKEDGTRACLEKLGIGDMFDGVYTDGMGYPAKPDPQIIGEIERSYSMDRESLAMVGDTRTDLLFARNGGIAGIGLARGARERSLLSPLADAVVGDIGELPATLQEL